VQVKLAVRLSFGGNAALKFTLLICLIRIWIKIIPENAMSNGLAVDGGQVTLMAPLKIARILNTWLHVSTYSSKHACMSEWR